MRSSGAHSRRFAYALAVSVVVHAAVLYGLPSLREPSEEPLAPPPLVTRIVELPKPEPEAEPEAAPAPPPEVKKRAPRQKAKRPEPPRQVARPAPAPAPPVAEAPSVAPPPPAAAPAPAAPPQVDTRAAEAASAAQYRRQLVAYAQRNKPPYPAMARENNWTGDVVLEIVIRADGRGELGLRRGSGHEVLDKLALDTYQAALRAVPLPSALRGRQVRLEPLRVVYNLTE